MSDRTHAHNSLMGRIWALLDLHKRDALTPRVPNVPIGLLKEALDMLSQENTKSPNVRSRGREMGEQIAFEAWRQYESWELLWSDDLDGIDAKDRPTVYSHMMAGIDIDLAKAMVRAEDLERGGGKDAAEIERLRAAVEALEEENAILLGRNNAAMEGK